MTNAVDNFRAIMNYKLTKSMEQIGLVTDIPSNSLLLPWSRVLLEKLAVAELVSKSPSHLLWNLFTTVHH
jgi:hypothetical protein